MKWFRKLARRLHFWLAAVSGLIVFVLCVTGCLYVFEVELRDSLHAYRHVQSRPMPVLPPSELRAIAEQVVPNDSASRVYYQGANRAAYVQFGNLKSQHYILVYLDPYDGTVLKSIDMNREFFHVVFSLHYRLLVPPKIGTTIVDFATLAFVFVLIAGIVNWWPRSRKALRQRLLIHWKSEWRRRIFDLHHIPGFYGTPFLLVLAVTGLVWGFTSVNDAVYWLVSGGQTRPPVVTPISRETADPPASSLKVVDSAWRRLVARHPGAEVIIVNFPQKRTDSIRYVVNPDRGTYYKTDHYYFDQYSGAELPVTHTWGHYADASPAAVVRRINYDIHVGAAGGLPGKILVFVVGLLGASLPVTGFLIWYGKRGRSSKQESP